MELYGTLGPACARPEILREMFAAGMCGLRLNLSHRSLEESGDWLAMAAAAAASCGAEGCCPERASPRRD